MEQDMDASSAALSAALPNTRTVRGARAPRCRSGPARSGLVPEYALLPALAEPRTPTVLAGTDHTALLRYTWLPTAAALGDPGAGRRAEAAARRAEGRRPRRRRSAPPSCAGPAATAPPGAPAGRLPQLTAKPLEVLGGHHVDHVFAAWYVQDRRSSILLVVDVSGSMLEPAPGTTTPLIDFVRQGCLAVGRLLPDQSSLGLWAFGSQLDPPRDYQVLLRDRAADRGAAGRADRRGRPAGRAAHRHRALRHHPRRVQGGHARTTGRTSATRWSSSPTGATRTTPTRSPRASSPPG